MKRFTPSGRFLYPAPERLLAALVLLASLLLPSGVYGQAGFPLPPAEEEAAETAEAGVENRLLLAISDPEYPVTPGDGFLVTFLAGGETVVNEVYVHGNYDVNLGLVGSINARGLTFLQLSDQVRQLVLRAYPSSNPAVRLIQTGQFAVPVSGAIGSSQRVPAWGLSRLSDVVTPLLRPYSSIRRVRLTSEGGAAVFDLFSARRFGEAAQDPVIKPGDEIEVLPAGPQVQVTGEVRRPGTYEISEDDTFGDLLRYVGGPTERANLSRIRVEYITANGQVTRYAVLTDDQRRQSASRIRAVFVTPRPEQRGYVLVSGAVNQPDPAVDPALGAAAVVPAPAGGADGEAAAQLRVPIAEGETLYDLFLRIREDLSDRADFSRALLARDGQPVFENLDLNSLLVEVSNARDFQLEPGDRLYVPFQTPFSVDFDTYVVVTGAVYAPGRYELREGRDAQYYIRQAGGPNPELNRNGGYTITDEDGDVRDEDAILQAGDTISVNHDDKVYVFNRYFPIISGGLGLMTTVLAVLAIFVGL